MPVKAPNASGLRRRENGTCAAIPWLTCYLHCRRESSARLCDGRGAAAPPTSADDDLFFAVRLTPNDVQSTKLLTSVIVDRSTQAGAFSIEAERRLADRWSLALELRTFFNIPSSDPGFGVRKDDFVQIRLSRFF